MTEPLQVSRDEIAVRVEMLDAYGPVDANTNEIAARLRELPAPALDGSDGALWCAALVDAGDAGRWLALVASAMIADGSSLLTLLDEIAALSRGETLDPLADLQYLHYSEWVHEQRDEGRLANAQQFWGSVEGTTAPLCLPGEQRESTGTLAEVAVEVSALGESETLTVWASVLGRLVQSKDLLFGVLHDGRLFDELNDSIGPFLELLPTRITWSADETVADVATRTGEWLETAAEQIPFADVVRQSLDQPGLGFSHRRLETGDGPPRALGHHEDALTDWFLLLHCRVQAGRMRLQLRYDTGLCSRQQARFLIESLEASISALTIAGDLANGRTTMASTPRIGAREFRQVVHEWNDACRIPGPEACVHRVFEDVVRRSPEAPAVVSEEASYTYAQLDGRANQLAHVLVAEGVEPGQRVAIALDRCADLVATLIAVLKVGCAYVPLDPSWPSRRLAALADRADVAAVICNPGVASHLQPLTVPKIEIDAQRLARMPNCAPTVACQPYDPAYLIFTSGSTGTPKAVIVEHRSVVNLAHALQAQIYDRAGQTLRLTLNAPISFDASVKQVAQLLNGHCLHVISEEARRDGEVMIRVLQDQQIDGLDCTPSQLKLLFAAGFEERAKTYPSVVLVGGEAIDSDMWSRLAAHPAECFNMYGPTEATVNASFAQILPGSTPNIGKPLHNVRLYLLDAASRPVPVGAPGELCIGGLGVGRGYYNSDETLSARFREDPFLPGGRLYSSGDIARWREDGVLEFIGRNDEQVKIRGYRIEPGEIAATLRQHPAVGDAAVITSGNAANPSLVAYVSLSSVSNFDADSFRTGLATINANETSYLYEEIFSKHTYVRHGIRLPDDACVLDVGANIGMFSMYVAYHCRRPKIHAFEPLTPIYDRLRLNCTKHVPDVNLHRIGLSAQEGSVEFTYYPGYSMMSGQTDYADARAEMQVIKTFLSNEEAEAPDSAVLLAHADELLADRFREERYHCTLRRLSDVMREQSIYNVDLLKIDVQRCEQDVLDGLDEDDWPRIQQIVMEVHDASGTESEGRTGRLLDLLECKGYAVEIEQDPLLRGTDRYNLYAWRPEYAAEASSLGEHLKSQHVPTAADFTAFLADLLPAHMIPAHYLTVPTIPLTRNGKLDKDALPEISTHRPDTGRPMAQPETWQERVLTEVWADVLGLDSVGVEDDFFQLGGDSIRSIQVQSQANLRGLNFPLQALFRSRTIRALVHSADLTATPEASTASEPFALVRESDRRRLPADAIDAYPLADLQAGMVFHSERTGLPQTYHNVTSYRIRAAWDEGRLTQVIRDVVAAHPALRTSFHLTGYSEPLQIVHRDVEIDFPVSDLTGLGRREQLALIDRQAREELCTRFDWAHAPLIRFRAHRLDDAEFMLTVAEYHAILDGWSLHLLVEEFRERYSAPERACKPVSGVPRVLSYARFLELERQARQSDACRSFWQEKLEGAPRHGRPFNSKIGETLDAATAGLERTQALQTELDTSTADALRGLAHSASIPLKSLLLAAHVRVMAGFLGNDDVITGLVTNGRPEESDGDRILGLFINTLPIRVQLGERTWLELAASCFEAEREMLPFRWMPIAEIHRMFPDTQHRESSIFDVFFNFTHFHGADGVNTEIGAAVVDTRTHPTDVDIPLAVDFEINSRSGAIELLFQFDATRVPRETVRKLDHVYKEALQALISDPVACCTSIELHSLQGIHDAALSRTSFYQSGAQATRNVGSASNAPPRTALEEQLAELWSELLGVEQVGRDETFASLGGHSLLLIRLLARVREMGETSLSTQHLHCRQTVAGLAQILAKSPNHDPASAPPCHEETR